ncbi:hypothetical protein B0H14DRAFT_2496205 [Mycena olivaceomarginata]|nr:hypothetical protein B0H14DRAFT_2496205 [Mycena olivaceomarginata]
MPRLMQPKQHKQRGTTAASSSRSQNQIRVSAQVSDYPEPLPESPPGSSSYHSGNSDEEELQPSEPEAPPEIKRIFHPHSQCSAVFQSFTEYVTSDSPDHNIPIDPTPWKPFRTRLDFEIAEFCELAILNKEMTKTLLSLIRQCGENIKEFTITTQTELEKLWGLASHKCTEFIEDSIVVPYKKENRTFKTFTRPLWEWALSLVQDPRLASVFVWDAEKAYKFNGDAYIRFYHEPWTANAFWRHR